LLVSSEELGCAAGARPANTASLAGPANGTDGAGAGNALKIASWPPGGIGKGGGPADSQSPESRFVSSSFFFWEA
jgi:hypothetical protein